MSMFAERLKILREDKDLMSKDFAKIMNVEPATVTNWEKGNRFPKDDVLVQIADFFDVSIDYLLGRTDNPNVKIVEADLNGHHYKIGINKTYPHDLSPEEVEILIEQLEESGFNIDKLIKKAKEYKK